MEWKWEDVIEELKMNLEELRALKEKSIPKKPVFDGLYQCPACKKAMLQGSIETKGNCCKNCGQALDWSTLKPN